MSNVVRWSEEQLAAHKQRAAVLTPPRREEKTPESAKAQTLPVAIGAERDQGMNKTEAEYAGMLEERKARREIAWWKYEAITFKLADDTRYTPDFAVMLPNGEFEIHETKGGFIREDGWQKLKIAAGMFPFRFFLCQKLAKKDGGGWKIKGV